MRIDKFCFTRICSILLRILFFLTLWIFSSCQKTEKLSITVKAPLSTSERLPIISEKPNAERSDSSKNITNSESNTMVPQMKEGENFLQGMIVGIDPGHQAKGNSDTEPEAPSSSRKKAKVTSGTDGRNSGRAEHEINLAVAQKLHQKLKEDGATVILTRESAEVDISNVERAQMMNEANVDLVLRLHCDGNDDITIHGASVLVPTGEYVVEIEKKSRLAGEMILNAFISETEAKNRGIHPRNDQTGFNWSTVPVCTAEMGFVSNERDELALIDEQYQEKCAEGLRKGIQNFWQHYQ